MVKEKLKFRLHTLLFCVAIFILILIARARMFLPWLFFIFAYIAAWALVLAFAVDFLIGDGKFSGRKIVLLTFGVIILSTPITHAVWTFVTPRWSFSVSTDKSTYRLDENVQITASLENQGFIAHSFKSSISEPIVISIETEWLTQVWYTPYHYNITEFTITPHQSLERTFTWNQTNIHYPERNIETGQYYIRAFIPSSAYELIDFDNLFRGWTNINITV